MVTKSANILPVEETTPKPTPVVPKPLGIHHWTRAKIEELRTHSHKVRGLGVLAEVLDPKNSSQHRADLENAADVLDRLIEAVLAVRAEVPCVVCLGTKKRSHMDRDGNQAMIPCNICKGSGKQYNG